MQSDHRIEYLDLGKGPAVLLLHDFLLTPDSWRQQISPLLSSGFRVILPDLAPGCKNDQLSDYANGLVALLNRLGLGRAVVIGMGMGGMILFDLLDRFPERVAGAGFICTRPVADDIQEKAKRGELIGNLLQRDGWDVRQDFLKMLVAGREKHLPDSDKLAIRQVAHQCSGQDLISSQKAIASRKDYSHFLKSLRLPTLVIGGEQDHLCHPSYTRIMAGQLPNCFRAINLDAGHLVQLEQPEAFNRQLLDFLQAIVPRRFSVAEQSSRKAA